MQYKTDEFIEEEQAGFRKGRSTVEQIFTINQIVEKYLEYTK